MAEDERDAAIVHSTVDLAHRLGLRVIAEGVETQATWELLAECGCDQAQGYFLMRPMPGRSRHGCGRSAAPAIAAPSTVARQPPLAPSA